MKNWANNKTFKSFDEQIQILKDRGLSFINKNGSNIENNFKYYLENFNYHNIVNGYNDFLMLNNDRKKNYYKKNSTAQNIIDLYEFDKKISSILFSRILEIEKLFATKICYYIMECNIDKSSLIKQGKILKINKEIFKSIFPNIEKIYPKEASIETKRKDLRDSILSYCKSKAVLNKYGNPKEIPIWVLSIHWSFGDLNKMFISLNDETRFKIFSSITKISDKSDEFILGFQQIMQMLNDFRNVLCHMNVLYKFNWKRGRNIIKKFTNEFVYQDNNIKQKNNWNIKLGDVIKIINFLSPCENTETINLIKKEIKELKEKLDPEIFNSIENYTRINIL